MNPWVIAGGAALALLLIFILRRRGALTETAVGPLLAQLQPPYTVLRGSIIQDEQGMIRLDYAVVSPYGVFVIQENREPGRIAVERNEEMWRVSGGERKKLFNPVWDIRKVIGKLERWVGEYPYIPLVVFTRARLTGDRDNSILEAAHLLEYVQSFRQKRLDDDQQRKILGILG